MENVAAKRKHLLRHYNDIVVNKVVDLLPITDSIGTLSLYPTLLDILK